MNMPTNLENDFIKLLSSLIQEKNDDASARLSGQENGLEDLACTAPALGKWIDNCDYPFLVETLLLNDAIFSQEFPGVQLSAAERKEFSNTLEGHCDACLRCRAKKSSDLDWKARVDNAFAENKEIIGKAIARAVGKK